MIRKFRIFLNPIEGQEKWLNEKAIEGLKLSKVGRFFYEFKKCRPNEYQYAVDYIGNKSNVQRKEYESFLADVEIKYFEKPLNLGQFSIGRVKYRPYANKGGKLATSRGMINREILILEKENNGNPFVIYNEVKDKIKALRERIKPHFYLLSFMIFLELYINFLESPIINISLLNNRNRSTVNNVALSSIIGAIGIVSMVRIFQLYLAIKSLKSKEENIYR